MKKLIPILTIAVAALFAAPVAEARGYHSRDYVSYHCSCGGPAWIETYVAYYTHCGRPVLRTRVIPIRRHYRPARPVYRQSHACPPPAYHSRGYHSRGGVSIHFGSHR